MFRTLSALTGLAALVAAAIIGLGTLVQASAPEGAENNDRADATECELRNWPYYRNGCLRDESRNAGRAVRARIVTTDRIDASRLSVNPLAEHSPSQDTLLRANVVSSAQRLKDASHRIAQDAVAEDAQGGFDWALSAPELRRYLSAGDFVRRTVR